MAKQIPDKKLISDLAEIMEKKDLSLISIKEKEWELKLKRGAELSSAAAIVSGASSGQIMPIPPVSAPVPPQALAPVAAEKPTAADAILSPMVGTAYLSPQPEAPAFVKVGDKVSAGQTLLIIEAMKVMNPITAPHAGVIREILVTDQQPVEYDEPLIVVN